MIILVGGESFISQATGGKNCIFRETLRWLRNMNDELSRLYRECNVLVYPFLWDGFGIPIVETLARGCNVVSLDILVFHEVGGDAVYYFDPHNIDYFCSAIDQAFRVGRG